MDLDGVAMTKYFRNDDVPDGFLWETWSAFEKDLEFVLDDMKRIGIEKGVLEVTPEGWLKGHGHPDKWFDAVESLRDDTTRDN